MYCFSSSHLVLHHLIVITHGFHKKKGTFVEKFLLALEFLQKFLQFEINLIFGRATSDIVIKIHYLLLVPDEIFGNKINLLFLFLKLPIKLNSFPKRLYMC